MITKLKYYQIFVFGSNLEGNHAGGAAKQAKEKFGAIEGIGAGFAGRTYAIPTMGGLDQIKKYVEQFRYIANYSYYHSDPDIQEFLLTPIGCGIAGYTPEQIAPLFKNFPPNVILPKEFEEVLNEN